jgi:hypothetical protein
MAGGSHSHIAATLTCSTGYSCASWLQRSYVSCPVIAPTPRPPCDERTSSASFFLFGRSTLSSSLWRPLGRQRHDALSTEQLSELLVLHRLCMQLCMPSTGAESAGRRGISAEGGNESPHLSVAAFGECEDSSRRCCAIDSFTVDASPHHLLTSHQHRSVRLFASSRSSQRQRSRQRPLLLFSFSPSAIPIIVLCCISTCCAPVVCEHCNTIHSSGGRSVGSGTTPCRPSSCQSCSSNIVCACNYACRALEQRVQGETGMIVIPHSRSELLSRV